MTEDDKALVDRLRKRRESEIIGGYERIEWEDEDALEAADRIEALSAENERLANAIANRLLGSSIDGRTIKELVSENKRLREWSLKAFTVVEWVSGEGKLLSYPYYDADDLLGDGVELLSVYSSDDARASLGDMK